MGVWQGPSGGQGLPKVSIGCVMPNPFTPCGRATPINAVSGVVCLQSEQPAAVFYPLGHPTPYAYEADLSEKSRLNLTVAPTDVSDRDEPVD
jgi:hypothetical protein